MKDQFTHKDPCEVCGGTPTDEVTGMCFKCFHNL